MKLVQPAAAGAPREVILRARLNWRMVGRTLAIVVGSLAVLSVGSHAWRFSIDHGQPHLRTLLFDANWEHSVTTYYQGITLLATSMLLAMITFHARRTGSSLFIGWGVLCLGFLWLSFDELCEMHETVGYLTESKLRPHGYFHYGWVIPGIAIAAIVGFAYLRFLFQLPRPTAITFVVAGAIYVGGAIGAEMIGGNYLEKHGEENLAYNLISDVEETGEMAGIALFITALSHFIGQNAIGIALSFDSSVTAETIAGSPNADGQKRRRVA